MPRQQAESGHLPERVIHRVKFQAAFPLLLRRPWESLDVEPDQGGVDGKESVDRQAFGYPRKRGILGTGRPEGTLHHTLGEVLAKYFGYDPDNTTSISRKDVTQQEWNNIIYGELEALRPVLVSGSNSIGHAFICDGSDSNGLFHINWGWGGRYNGYFDITTLCQYQADIIGGDDGFNRGNSIVCGIAPDNGIKDAPIHETPTISSPLRRMSFLPRLPTRRTRPISPL